ncbi:hypothetical protein LWI29_015872 [Acer saccharum]|uniref:Uncharacterized protein n=1 Tax=Acer saccharum TaxID=4024 RepID=A0AA39SGF9_ACESA|nr:hypothetical protein LWI29_015872 [Acer saccharum]
MMVSIWVVMVLGLTAAGDGAGGRDGGSDGLFMKIQEMDMTCVSEEVFVGFDLPPLFDEKESIDDSDSFENVVSSEYNSQGLALLHHRLGMMTLRI